MRRFRSVLALAVVLVCLAGCAPKGTTFETPAAHRLFDANEVLKRVGEVEDTTIELQAQNQIALKDARVVIHICRILDIALPTTGDGWRTAALTAAWNAALVEIPELGEMPSTWQGAIRQAWKAGKMRVPLLSSGGVYAIAVGAIDGALVEIGG